MRKRLTVIAVVLGLLAMSGVALAANEDREDTVFNFGYDSEAGVLVWNITPSDSLYDCTLENGPLDTTYTRVPDGVVLVDLLAESGDPVMFPARAQSELAEGLVEADGPAEYTGSDGECGLSGGSVAGPNGQVNHGMFMRLFNSVFEGPGRGCVVRHLAQSDLGKGDQQVRVSDVDPDVDPEAVESGSIEFETEYTDCVHGNQDEDKVTGQERAAQNRPDHAAGKADKGGPPEGRGGPPADRGNSGSAPGKNK